MIQIVAKIRAVNLDPPEPDSVRFTMRGNGPEFTVVAAGDSEFSGLLWDAYRRQVALLITIGDAPPTNAHAAEGGDD